MPLRDWLRWKKKDENSRFLVEALARHPAFLCESKNLYKQFGKRFSCFADFWETMEVWEELGVIGLIEFEGDEFVHLKMPIYQIILPTETENLHGIHCFVCDRVSYDQKHVADRWCEQCQLSLGGKDNP